MSYIIDGHNLIGVLPDIELNQPDDEVRLLARLRAYRAHSGGRSMIVFFDSGPSTLLRTGPSTGSEMGPSRRAAQDLAGQAPDLSSPGVQVRFSAPGQTADDAIVEYLRSRAQPGQYAVVTNDQELAWRARDVGASVLRASEFAAKLAPRRRLSAASEATEMAYDPRHPAYADIYATFIESEKSQARFREEEEADASVWIERLYNGAPQLAQRAARWLGQAGGEPAVEPLCNALMHDNAGVRAAALLALADLGQPVAIPDLIDRLSNDTNSMVREAAAQALGRIGDRTAEAALEVASRSDTKSKVRKAARAALEQVRARQGGAARSTAPGRRRRGGRGD